MTRSTDAATRMGNRPRPLLLYLITICIGTFLPLFIAEGILQFLPVATGLHWEPVNETNPIVHFEPNRQFTYSQGWSLGLVQTRRTNNVGYVNDQDYLSTGPRPLIAVIGDLYVEAMMVAHRDTLQGRLEDQLADKARVYSFGASGAPLS